jgi:site-specific DNA-methyltransferase (cytosine-N4-specific)
VTSPPYWGPRDYGTGTWVGGDPACPHTVASVQHHPGTPLDCRRCPARRVDRQYGLEPTIDEYIATLRRVFAELRRVLDPAGTVWLNLGDSYSTTPRRGRRADSISPSRLENPGSIPGKNLVGMPWRVALALQADGWILRNAIVWAKRNPMPESVRDRLSTTYEFVFLLTTQPRYYFNLDPIRVPLVRPEALAEGITVGGIPGVQTGALGASARRRGGRYGAKYDDPAPFSRTTPGAAIRPTGRRHTAAHPRGKNPGDVWSLSTRPLREAHFAAFPIDIPLRCIAAGCPPDGVVLDPFSGAATTGLAALQLGRRYVGIDLNPDYTALAQRRLTAARQHDPRQSSTSSSPLPEVRS